MSAPRKADSAAAAKPLPQQPPPFPGVDASREEKHAWLEELARYQGVKPKSFEDHADLWPFGEEEAKDLFDFVIEFRRREREKMKGS